MNDSLPVSIALIYSITKQLDRCHSFLDRRTMDFRLLKLIVNEAEIIDQDPRFLNSPHIIRYMQMTLLMGMSMFGGITVTSLSAFTDTEEGVQLTWDSGMSDRFKWGIYDDDFVAFCRYYQDRLSSKPQFRDYLPTEIFVGISGFLKSYMVILDAVEQRINRLLTSKQKFLTLFAEDINRDLLFIVMSSLPQDNLNALFIDINQYFPPDFEVLSPDGRRMKLAAIFDNPSVDMEYLLKKVHIYLDLYFNDKMPIIKEITRSKTIAYMAKLFGQSDVFESTQHNILKMKESQLISRKRLYKTFKNHLDALI